MGGEGEHENSLEFTSTWVMAIVFAVFAIISLTVRHTFRFFGTLFRKTGGRRNNQDNQPGRHGVLRMLKRKVFPVIGEELLFMAVYCVVLHFSANHITKISIPRCLVDYMLPCSLEDHHKAEAERQAGTHPKTTFCSRKDMVPLLSTDSLQQIHLFIFFLSVMHIILSFVIIALGQFRIDRLKNYSAQEDERLVINVVDGILNGFLLASGRNGFRLKVFVLSFFCHVTQSEYLTLKYCLCTADDLYENTKAYFLPYLMSVHRDYFKQIAGISLYLWVFVVFSLLLNVHGWHAYFWTAFIPIIPLIFVGAILKHIVTQQAIERSEDYRNGIYRREYGNQLPQAMQEQISQEAKAYWFNCPHFVLQLIHFTIFLTSFEMATLLWIGITYGFDSCMMGQLNFTISRLIVGVCTLGLCGWNTLPLYTIVKEMERDGFYRLRLNDVIEEQGME